MAPQQTTVRIVKSVAGAVLAGLGMFILYSNTAGAVAHVRHVLANGTAALGSAATVLVLAQHVHALGLEHQRSLQIIFHQMLLSALWPLFLVIFGTALSRETFTENPKHHEPRADQGGSHSHQSPLALPGTNRCG
jgi:hypothetical protein